MSMKFDFRTKLLVIVLTMSLVAVLTSDILIYTLLGVLSVYLIIQGFGRQTIKYLIVCGIFIVLRLLSGGQGITILMPEMFLFMVLRILMMVMAAQPVIGMPPGEVVAVFKKIHAPNGIALPVTFMLRFFPTVRSEFSDVFSSLRLRKLLSWKHPLDAMEYIVTPVIFQHKIECSYTNSNHAHNPISFLKFYFSAAGMFPRIGNPPAFSRSGKFFGYSG